MVLNRAGARTFVALLLLLPLAEFNIGCAKRVPLSQAQTVTLNLNQVVAAIAASNKAVATDVIALNQSKLIGNDTTNAILTYSRVVAQSVLTAENIQKGTLSDADKTAAVKVALSVLKLPAVVSTFLSGPQANQTVTGLISTIQAMQALILSVGGK